MYRVEVSDRHIVPVHGESLVGQDVVVEVTSPWGGVYSVVLDGVPVVRRTEGSPQTEWFYFLCSSLHEWLNDQKYIYYLDYKWNVGGVNAYHSTLTWMVVFQQSSHAVHFKLTWGGV